MSTATWELLQAHAERLAAVPVRELLEQDAQRFSAFAREQNGLLFDFSRQRLDAAALDALLQLAEDADLRGQVEALLGGEAVNTTEQRAALHTLLRTPAGAGIPESLAERHAAVLATRARCRAFVADVHGGSIASTTGERFTDVINIGIGGSDLGPAMAAQALAPFGTGHVTSHFVSNVDGTQLADLTGRLDPARTLVIICSKTFTTQETLANARRARAWISDALGKVAIPQHFAAVSVNDAAMDEFGIGPELRFAMWDWVGGRYSLWSAVGLSLELAIGSQNFEAMLAGAHAMDEHFREAPARANLPVLAGLLAIWNRNLLGCDSHAVLPYSQRLARLPAYLQQLEMESLGKGVGRDGQVLERDSGAVIWGEPGSNAQHSFYQLLHQGTARVSLDMILPLTGAADAEGDELVIANCLAQAGALADGSETGDPHRRHPGSRPLSVIAFKALDPATLGRLLAFYEHRVFVQAAIWGINPFDQFGVELGKQRCKGVLAGLQGEGAFGSGSGLLEWVRRQR